MLRLRVGFALAVLALAAGALSAQKSNPKTKVTSNRSGQWIGFGFGIGVPHVGCDICTSSRPGSLSGYVKVGGTLSRKVLLGVESDGWIHNSDEVDEYLLGLAGMVYYYPNPKKRLFYKAGLGGLRFQMDDGPNRLSSMAFGINLGAGYDYPYSRSVSFSPFVTVFVASLGGGIEFNGEPAVESNSLILLQLGMGVTWH